MNKKILVTGGTGMLGQALKKIMPEAIYVNTKSANLCSSSEAFYLVDKHRPDIIIHLAAKVAGLEYNMHHPVNQINENILINTNLLAAAWACGVKNLIAMASTCIYPDKASKYPMTEDMLHEGTPPPGNLEYAYAKRLMCVQIEAYNRQFGTEWSYLIPSNMYGPGDNYKPGTSHFIGTLIREIHHAKYSGLGFIKLPGTGNVLRQFIYSEDVALLIKKCIDYGVYTPINIAYPENRTYREIADIALNVLDAKNISITWDQTKPDGQFRKDGCIDKLYSIFPDTSFTLLHNGIKKAFDEYVKSNQE